MPGFFYACSRTISVRRLPQILEILGG